jgi:excisionase family DNA binding protein
MIDFALIFLKSDYAIKPAPIVALSPSRLAEAIGIRREKIAAAIKSGALSAYRDGTKFRVIVSDAESRIKQTWGAVNG